MAKKKRPVQIGGSAQAGAKSTQARQTPETNDPQELQYSSYNRDMRRRMQNMGTAPESQKGNPNLDKRKKMLEKREKKQQELRQAVSKKIPKSTVAVGARGWIFPIIVFVILALLIGGFLILRATGILPS